MLVRTSDENISKEVWPLKVWRVLVVGKLGKGYPPPPHTHTRICSIVSEIPYIGFCFYKVAALWWNYDMLYCPRVASKPHEEYPVNKFHWAAWIQCKFLEKWRNDFFLSWRKCFFYFFFYHSISPQTYISPRRKSLKTNLVKINLSRKSWWGSGF